MMDRRRFLQRSAAVAGGLVAGSALSGARSIVRAQDASPGARGRFGGPPPRDIGGELIFVGGSSVAPVRDARQQFIVDVMKADYNVDVTLVNSLDYARMEIAMSRGRADFDLVSADTFFSIRAANAGWLEPIDYDIVDASQLVPGSDLQYWVNTAIAAEHIAWNTNTFPAGAGPASWAEFYDAERFPGRRALRSGAFQTLPGAALADGVAPEDLYPLDLDRAFAALERIRPHVVKWADGGQEIQTLLTTGEADMVNLFTGRAAVLKRDGEPVDFRMEQATTEEVSFIIPKDSPNKLQAMYALALLVNQPVYNQAMAEAQLIGYTNIEGMAMVDPELQPLLTTSPDNLPKLAPNGSEWWAENEPAAQQRMTEWILG